MTAYTQSKNLQIAKQLPTNGSITLSSTGVGVTGAVGSSIPTGYGINTLGQLQTINLTTGVTASDLFATTNINMHPEVKKYEIYESPEDLLVLSTTWKRLRDNGRNVFGKLLDRNLFSEITPEDRTKADEIRDYYSKKIMMWKLKGKSLTPFREDLNSFIHSDGTKFRENMFGMVYYLPEFYQYDQQVDQVKEQVKIKGLVSNVVRLPVKGSPQDKTLEPIAKIKVNTKRLKQNQYWFKDIQTDGAVMLSIDVKNPLEHIWSHMFETKSLLTISGHYFLRDRDDFEYFSIADWNLVTK